MARTDVPVVGVVAFMISMLIGMPGLRTIKPHNADAKR